MLPPAHLHLFVLSLLFSRCISLSDLEIATLFAYCALALAHTQHSAAAPLCPRSLLRCRTSLSARTGKAIKTGKIVYRKSERGDREGQHRKLISVVLRYSFLFSFHFASFIVSSFVCVFALVLINYVHKTKFERNFISLFSIGSSNADCFSYS